MNDITTSPLDITPREWMTALKRTETELAKAKAALRSETVSYLTFMVDGEYRVIAEGSDLDGTDKLPVAHHKSMAVYWREVIEGRLYSRIFVQPFNTKNAEVIVSGKNRDLSGRVQTAIDKFRSMRVPVNHGQRTKPTRATDERLNEDVRTAGGATVTVVLLPDSK